MLAVLSATLVRIIGLVRLASLVPSLRCSALIFDLDGVLLDSNAIYEHHWKAWASRNSVPFESIIAVHHGRPVSATIREVAPHLDAHVQARAYKASLEAARSLEGARIFPGVLEMLDALPPGAWAIATSAPADFAHKLADHLGLPLPRVFVTGDDVLRGKPHPMPYLRAAEALGVPAAQCMVVEDAPAGVTSARAAGAFVIGVLTTNTAEALAEAHAITRSTADISVRCDAHGLQVSWLEPGSGTTAEDALLY